MKSSMTLHIKNAKRLVLTKIFSQLVKKFDKFKKI